MFDLEIHLNYMYNTLQANIKILNYVKLELKKIEPNIQK